MNSEPGTSSFRYCPTCGSSAFTSHDLGRSYKCDSCGLHFFVNNAAAVACLIVNPSGDLLLTRRAVEPAKGMLDLPGGFVDPGETAAGAVAREIMEELNVRVSEMTFLCSFPNWYPWAGYTVPTLDLAFVCEVEDFSTLKAGDDAASIEFISPDHLNFNELCSDSMREIIRFYLNTISKKTKS